MHRKKKRGDFLIITLTMTLMFSSIAVAAEQEPGYILYTVRAGDTLYEIAKEYNTTIEALRLENGITDSMIITGQILKISSGTDEEKATAENPAENEFDENSQEKTDGETIAEKDSGENSVEKIDNDISTGKDSDENSEGKTTGVVSTENNSGENSDGKTGSEPPEKIVRSETNRSGVTFELRDADIRDVLSTLAMIMKKNIIYTEEAIRVSLSIQNVSASKALEILAQSYGLSYITDGSLILVGSSANINQNFYTLLPVTRFTLNYLSPEQINAQVDKLGIPVQKIILDSTQKYIWAQGTPQALAKMRELVAALDREENVDPITLEPVKEFTLTPIDLQYVESSVINTLITQLGIPCRTIIFESNPWTLWVDADDSAMKDLLTLVESVDIAENYVPEVVEEEEEEEEEEEVIIPPPRIEAKKMMNITSARLLPLIQDLDIPVKIIAIDSSGYNIWMRGDQESINLMNELINRLDNYFSRDDVNFFIHKLENMKASTAMEKLNFIGLQDVQVMSLNYPEFSKDLLIACPADRIIDVRNVLRKLDVPGEKIRVIVDSSTTASAKTRLEARRDLIVQLTGIPKESFQVSQNISKTDHPLYVLWVEESSDNVALIRDVIASMDAMGGGQGSPDSGGEQE